MKAAVLNLCISGVIDWSQSLKALLHRPIYNVLSEIVALNRSLLFLKKKKKTLRDDDETLAVNFGAFKMRNVKFIIL